MDGDMIFSVEPKDNSWEGMHYVLRIDEEDVSIYTDPDRKAIEDEVWEFVRCVHKMNGDDYHECFDIDDVSDEDYCSKYSYQEAKTQYDAWKKLKEEIHVGDEVEYCGDNCVVVYVGADEVYHVSDKHWSRYVVHGRQFLTRTGRHFSEVEKLLERMREE